MIREILILRHCHSDWDPRLMDKVRPLTERGRRDAVNIGCWFARQNTLPRLIQCSTALRARQTLDGVLDASEQPDRHIEFDDSLYLADLQTLLRCLHQSAISSEPLMIVGHNPGLSELVDYLLEDEQQPTRCIHRMSTGNLVHIEYPDGERELRGRGRLLYTVRPADIAT